MAKTTTYLAIDPAGRTHKRTSQNRTYSCTVVVRKGAANAQRDFDAAEAWRRPQDAKNFAYFAANSTFEPVQARLLKKFPTLAADPSYAEREAARNAEAMEGCTTAEEYVEMRAAERLADFKATDHEKYLNAGWCGRSDLGLKLAAQQKGFAEVVILPVKVK